MNSDVLINFVLDSSGSMYGIRQATIQAFNDFITEQKAVEGDARLSLTLFSTAFDVRYVAEPLSETMPLGSVHNQYGPAGGTALLDAVGTTIKGTEAWLANHPEWTGRVVCVVLTDGEENASQDWHINQPMVEGDEKDVAGLIAYKQHQGWEFVFLGSGGSDWLERTFGHVVAAERFLGYAGADTNHVYAGVSASLTNSRSTGAAFKVNQP